MAEEMTALRLVEQEIIRQRGDPEAAQLARAIVGELGIAGFVIERGWQKRTQEHEDGRWFLAHVTDPEPHMPACGIIPVKWVNRTHEWCTKGVSGIQFDHLRPLPAPPTEDQ